MNIYLVSQFCAPCSWILAALTFLILIRKFICQIYLQLICFKNKHWVGEGCGSTLTSRSCMYYSVFDSQHWKRKDNQTFVLGWELLVHFLHVVSLKSSGSMAYTWPYIDGHRFGQGSERWQNWRQSFASCLYPHPYKIMWNSINVAKWDSAALT